MEIQQGQIWTLKNIPNRPDVVVVRIGTYSQTVHWSYVGQSAVFESKTEAFLKDFAPKAS